MESKKKWYKWTHLQNRKWLIDLKMNLWLPAGGRMRERDSLGVWDGSVHTAIFKMDKQQVSTI